MVYVIELLLILLALKYPDVTIEYQFGPKPDDQDVLFRFTFPPVIEPRLLSDGVWLSAPACADTFVLVGPSWFARSRDPK